MRRRKQSNAGGQPSVVGSYFNARVFEGPVTLNRPELGPVNPTAGLDAASEQLEAIALRMAGYRDLPMGRHDEKRMSDSDSMAALPVRPAAANLVTAMAELPASAA